MSAERITPDAAQERIRRMEEAREKRKAEETKTPEQKRRERVEDTKDKISIDREAKAELAAEAAANIPPLPILDVDGVLAEDTPSPVIAGMLWSGCITVFVAAANLIKTFFLLAASASVSSTPLRPRTADLPNVDLELERTRLDGADILPGLFLNRATQSGAVVYISFESGDALGLRIQALRDRGLDMRHFYVIRPGAPISPRREYDGTESPSPGEQQIARALAAIAERQDAPIIRLIVIETVRASMDGSEDSSEVVASYLRAVRRIMAPYPCAAVALSHHSGWQDGEAPKKRERGSSDFRGTPDASFYFELTENTPGLARFSMRCTKTRDEAKVNARIIRRVVDVTYRGRHRTTCVVGLDTRTDADIEAAKVQEQAADDADLDARILAAIANNPGLTSRDSVRASIGGGENGKITAAIGRLEAEGRITRAGKRAPWTVTGGPQ